jgi:hypothetical protein
MKKVFDLNSSCGFWSPGKSVKGNPLNVRECWACRFSLFGYCWLEDWPEDELVRQALEGIHAAKQKLHDKLRKEGKI